MILHFGKHRGKQIQDIPPAYLYWLLDNVQDLSPTLRRGIEQQLGIGFTTTTAPPPAIITEIVDPWYRRLSLIHHPDRGGSHERMLAINSARDLLVEMTGVS